MTQRERQILQLIEADPMISQQTLADSLGITRSSVAVHISNLMRKGYIAGKGYVVRSGSYAAVVGGVNMDIGGRSFAPLVPADSNPGAVSLSLGGVGRNIATNLSLLGTAVKMLTAYGDDIYGKRVAASCSQLDIDLSHALCLPDQATSTYLYIESPEGEMTMALSDMEVCRRITPSYLAANLTLLQNAQVVAVDCNIPQESLIYLAENCTAPIFCDPVSTGKAGKLLPVLDKLHTLKPNRIEAELLSGVPIPDKAQAPRAAKALLEKGVQRVFITLGPEGVYCADREQGFFMENLPGKKVSATGCGDAFTAALVWAYLEGMDLKDSARAGLAASAIALESRPTINPAMSATALRQRMK